MHGDAYNGAYMIGEDLCENANILISGEVKAKLEKEHERFGCLRYEE